jgi:hypothetical protein
VSSTQRTRVRNNYARNRARRKQGFADAVLHTVVTPELWNSAIQQKCDFRIPQLHSAELRNFRTPAPVAGEAAIPESVTFVNFVALENRAKLA